MKSNDILIIWWIDLYMQSHILLVLVNIEISNKNMIKLTHLHEFDTCYFRNKANFVWFCQYSLFSHPTCNHICSPSVPLCTNCPVNRSTLSGLNQVIESPAFQVCVRLVSRQWFENKEFDHTVSSLPSAWWIICSPYGFNYQQIRRIHVSANISLAPLK
jgi:hypothetical protein